jgi:hypothetical protein
MVGLAAVVLGGCQEQRTVVLEQASAGSVAASAPGYRLPPPRPRVMSPCAASAGSGPYEPLTPPIKKRKTPLPARAVPEQVRGCAGIRFRISPDGTPRDDLAWHYIGVNIDPQPHPG